MYKNTCTFFFVQIFSKQTQRAEVWGIQGRGRRSEGLEETRTRTNPLFTSGSQTETPSAYIVSSLKLGNKSTQTGLQKENYSDLHLSHNARKLQDQRGWKQLGLAGTWKHERKRTDEKVCILKDSRFKSHAERRSRPPQKTSTGAARRVECLRMIGSSAAVEMETVPWGSSESSASL